MHKSKGLISILLSLPNGRLNDLHRVVPRAARIYLTIAIVISICACGISPKYEFEYEETELLPLDAAAKYLNQNQLLNECRWSAEAVKFPGGKVRRLDEHRFTWQVNHVNNRYSIIVRGHIRGQFLDDLCHLASISHNRALRSPDLVRNMVLALESLGIGPGYMNR